MTIDFDTMIDRRGTDSAKWNNYGEDVLPLWVADMDFRSPEPVIAALRERAEQGLFGYQSDSPELRALLQARMADRYGWQIEQSALHFVPGIVSALNVLTKAIGKRGDAVLVQTPVYPPFLSAPANSERVLQTADLRAVESGTNLRYEIDFEAFEAAITPQTRLFILCNPHNPLGRVYTRAEQEKLAEICLRHDLIICSDEIHSDLILEGKHTPIASLSPEIEARTITLIAPSKTFNVPGLGCGIAIIPNDELGERFEKAGHGIVPGVNIMGYTGAVAAYRDGQPWLDELLPYLREMRDVVDDFVAERLPGVRVTQPEGTYLAWLDFNGLRLPTSPYDFFLKEAKVALTDGAAFGKAGEGFARLNFGCCRDNLKEALERMADAVDRVR